LNGRLARKLCELDDSCFKLDEVFVDGAQVPVTRPRTFVRTRVDSSRRLTNSRAIGSLPGFSRMRTSRSLDPFLSHSLPGGADCKRRHRPGSCRPVCGFFHSLLGILTKRLVAKILASFQRKICF
jgi:hypothetical protein